MIYNILRNYTIVVDSYYPYCSDGCCQGHDRENLHLAVGDTIEICEPDWLVGERRIPTDDVDVYSIISRRNMAELLENGIIEIAS